MRKNMGMMLIFTLTVPTLALANPQYARKMPRHEKAAYVYNRGT